MIWAFLMASVAIIHEPPVTLPSGDLVFNLRYLSLIWFSWFLVIFVVFFVVFALAGFAGSLLDHRLGYRFWQRVGKSKPKFIWVYSALVGAIISFLPATFLLFTALDPGHYNGEFCLERGVEDFVFWIENCEFDVLEMAGFWFFWFMHTFLLLYPSLGLFLIFKTGARLYKQSR